MTATMVAIQAGFGTAVAIAAIGLGRPPDPLASSAIIRRGLPTIGNVLEIVGGWADSTWDVGIAFGTVGVRKGDHKLEITTYRAEAYDRESRKPEVSYGDSLQGEDDPEARSLRELGITRVTADEVRRDPAGAAAHTLAAVERSAEQFVLHVDVDVLDFTEVPLADIPNAEGRRLGLTLDELTTSMRVFAGSPSCAAVVLTEVNPAHAPDAGTLPHFVERLAAALTGR